MVQDSIFGGSPIHERGLDESARNVRMPSPPLKSLLTTIRQGTDSEKEDNLELSLEEDSSQDPVALPPPSDVRVKDASVSVGEAFKEAQGSPVRDSTGTGRQDSAGVATGKRELFHATHDKPAQNNVEYVEVEQGEN